MATSAAYSEVPSWNGDASSFEAFATACRWYQKSLKSNEQHLAAPRIWQRLTGPAKSVVKHLPPEDFEDARGLGRLLDVLRASPLQTLPVPDSFSRLEKWHQLKRAQNETIPQLLVREEDLFQELQQSLVRARADREGTSITGPATSSISGPRVGFETPINPPSTPSQSPLVTGAAAIRREQASVPASTAPPVTADQQPSSSSPSGASPLSLGSFFEDELRGYRLMKAARLNQGERQHVLVQTKNTTNYHAIRLALRTLFAEDFDRDRVRAHHGAPRHAKACYGEEWYGDEPNAGDDQWNEASPSSWDDWEQWSIPEESYWQNDWAAAYWDEYGHDQSWEDAAWHDEQVAEAEIAPPSGDSPEEKQLQEAYALAGEAIRTLQEARDAVRKVRAARGYYSPESNSGKGMSPSASKSKGKGSPDGYRRCFICGMYGHPYTRCPDRFSKGGRPSGKGRSGKGKGGGKGKVHFNEIYVNVNWDDVTSLKRSATRAVIDTGATENAVGVDCLDALVSFGSFDYDVHHKNLPVFKFGNGQKAPAVSCVSLHDTSLGNLSFFVLGDSGSTTPPLLGAKTLRRKKALVSYANGLFMFAPEEHEKPPHRDGHFVNAVQMRALASGHLTIDLAAPPTPLCTGVDRDFLCMLQPEPVVSLEVGNTVEKHEIEYLYMMNSCDVEFHDDFERENLVVPQHDVKSRIEHLAQRLKVLRRSCGYEQHIPEPDGSGRSSSDRLSMLLPSQGGPSQDESVCNLGMLHEVRASHQVCSEETRAWKDSADGPGSSHHQIGDDRPREECPSSIGDTGHGQWKSHGDQRKNAANGCPNTPCFEHDSGGVPRPPEEVRPSGWCRPEGHRPDRPAFIIGSPKCQGCHEGNCGEAFGGGDRPGDPDQANVNEVDGAPGGAQAEEECWISRQEGEGQAEAQSGSVLVTGGDSRDGRRVHFDGCSEGGREEFGILASLKSLRSRLTRLRGKGSCGAGKGSLEQPMAEIQTDHPQTSEGHNPLLSANEGTKLHDDENLMASESHRPVVRDEHGQPFEVGSLQANMWTQPKKQVSKNVLTPSLAKKLSVQAAVLGAMVLAPVHTLMSQMSGQVDFMEVACAANSSLSAEMEEKGFSIKRINFLEGYDLDTKKGTAQLRADIVSLKPRMTWVSLPCTRLSPLVNLTQRTEEEWGNFQKRQHRDLKRADEVSEAICEVLDDGCDFAWEWPTGAAKGWKAKCISRLLSKMRSLERPVYWCRFHADFEELVSANLQPWSLALNAKEMSWAP